ncbi:MAG: SprB repeat-containing protein [Lewinellaceae bacterium]|nr:SprB repeat-containing protein [Lewinellaceae bacterium]
MSGGGGGDYESIVWYTGSCGGTQVGTGNGLSVSPVTTTTYFGRYENGSPCNYATTCVTAVVTVEADPIAPVIAKSPNLAAVCEGTTLTVSVTTSGSGGTGTCDDEYRYSTDNGGIWSSWSPSLPSFAAVTGTNLVESRRNCDGDGCNSNVNQVSWTVNPRPTAGTCNEVPDACYNNMGSIDVQASGGTPPYTVTWSPMHGSLSPALANDGDTGTISGLHAGQAYTITVTDSNGCQAP